jgi:hypothetical protein
MLQKKKFFSREKSKGFLSFIDQVLLYFFMYLICNTGAEGWWGLCFKKYNIPTLDIRSTPLPTLPLHGPPVYI